MFANIRGVGLFGMNSFGVNVEVEISKGIEKEKWRSNKLLIKMWKKI